MRLIDADKALQMIKHSMADCPCENTLLKEIWNRAHLCAMDCVQSCETVEASINAMQEQGWDPVESSPKEKGCYIVTVNHWLDGKPVAREAYWNGADWLSCEKRQEITQRVTHWMTMPEVPKEENNG